MAKSDARAMNWKDVIKDPEETKVFMALDGPNYTWRTARAVARQTGLSEARVWEIVAKYNRELSRLSEVPSLSGSALAGLREKVG